MKKSLPAFVFSVLLFYLPVTYGQIIEDIDIPILEERTDSSAQSSASQCFPPCRNGFFCHGGQCISKCNPPCPDGMDCWDDAECHPRASTIQKALNDIDAISRVTTNEDLVQGTVIRTNFRKARVRILDTTFECNGELFLNLPKGDYTLYVDAPRYFVNEEDLEVRLGTVETLEVKLRPFQINAGVAMGASSLKEFSLLAGEINLGLGLFARTYVGLTGAYMGPFDGELSRLTDYTNADIPDTVQEVWTELTGIGFSCGYLGINPIVRRIKFIPQISIGYWEYDDQTYFLNKFQNGRTEYLDDLEQHDIEKYFIRPTLEVRIGERAFNFDGRISVFLGTGTPIVALLVGFQIVVPR
jgi:hypothetical protein